MDNEKIFDLMERMYVDLKAGQEKLEAGQQKLEVGQLDLKNEIHELKSNVKQLEIKVENDINSKLQVLFDGYKQNTEQLNRIEQEVSKHEEIILRRVK